MKALLLAAGMGTRLRPLTEYLPKCLVPIHGLPLLMWWVELLGRGGIKEILINTHYMADLVEAAFAASPYAGRVNLIYERDLLATGGTLLANRDYFGTDDVMVAHADNLSMFDVSGFVRTHLERKRGCVFTMMTFRTPDPKSCGIVSVDADGVVQGFFEKVNSPPGDLANGAVYVFSPDIYPFLLEQDKPVIDISTEVIPHFLGRIQTFHNSVFHRDIGTIGAYSEASQSFAFPFEIGWRPDADWWRRLLGDRAFHRLEQGLSLT